MWASGLTSLVQLQPIETSYSFPPPPTPLDWTQEPFCYKHWTKLPRLKKVKVNQKENYYKAANIPQGADEWHSPSHFTAVSSIQAAFIFCTSSTQGVEHLGFYARSSACKAVLVVDSWKLKVESWLVRPGWRSGWHLTLQSANWAGQAKLTLRPTAP